MRPLLSSYLTRMRFKMASPFIAGDVLDIGCGKGGLADHVKITGRYAGIETNPKMCAWLRSNRPEMEVIEANLDTDPPELQGQFDTIVMLAIIEHLKDPDGLLKMLPGWLKPQGKIVITTPTPRGNVIHQIGARLGLFYQSAVEEHQTIFSRALLEEKLTLAGIETIYYKQFLLGGNQFAVCQKRIG